MYQVVVTRDWGNDRASLGVCQVIDPGGNVLFEGQSLERGWRDNEKNSSCVPPGEYDLKLEYSPRFKKDLWELYGVPNRRECKFHAANYWHQLNGCIALGQNRRYIDGDAVLDVTDSRKTMSKFHKALENANGIAKLKIIES